MNDREKKLLTLRGKYPTMSLEELQTRSSYKWKSTITRKIKHYKKQKMIFGPIYYIDYGKLCKNQLNQMYCIIESHNPYEKVVSYLKLIKSIKWAYPVRSPHRTALDVSFTSSNDDKTRDLLQLLKDNHIIAHYTIYSYHCNKHTENPNFCGDFVPSFNTLLDPCDVPDMSCGHHDTTWNTCDIAVLPYFETGYKACKFVEILRAERILQNPWTYEQIKYSFKKMVTHKLIQKTYIIYPIAARECTMFLLYLKTETPDIIQRILYNFGKESRIYKHYVFNENWGILCCVSHPLFFPNLLQKLDMDVIQGKELYQIDSIIGMTPIDLPTELKCFNMENQTLEYPYQVYKETIKEQLEQE
ncbi:MAG: hypothetical protein PVF58_10155 [Candidatus Methanofastidiosia archaeon]|jgi:hypothetical protein